jgi:hypothetical protein
MADVRRCRFCGREIRFEPDAQAILHEEPVCATFNAMAHSGSEMPEVRTLGGEEAIASHLAALKRRLRLKASS